jgi:hypothetical protein
MPFIEMLTHSSDFAQWHQHFPRFFCFMNRIASILPGISKKRFMKPLEAIQILQSVSLCQFNPDAVVFCDRLSIF